MREPSRILASATAVILLVAAVPAAAASSGSSSLVEPPTPQLLHAVIYSDSDPGCEDPRRPSASPMTIEWWRQWWHAATSRRVTRQPSPEQRQPIHAPFYLRSPMMSGFFGWDSPNGCDDQSPATTREAARLRARVPLPADSTLRKDSTALRP